MKNFGQKPYKLFQQRGFAILSAAQDLNLRELKDSFLP
jgi:hypothetical protein